MESKYHWMAVRNGWFGPQKFALDQIRYKAVFLIWTVELFLEKDCKVSSLVGHVSGLCFFFLL